MIANILKSANSTSIAINASVDRFPPLAHPSSVVFSPGPLTRDALRSKLGDNLVPGVITGLEFESMAPLNPTGDDWVNLREHSSAILSQSGPQVGTIPPGRPNAGQPLSMGQLTTTALVMDPADIRSAITKGVVATIPVWEVKYSSPLENYRGVNVNVSYPSVKLGARPGRLPRNHSFRRDESADGTIHRVLTMTATKSAAPITATYRPFSEL